MFACFLHRPIDLAALASVSSFRTTSADSYAEIHLKERGKLSLEDGDDSDTDILKLIQQRHSTRVPYDPNRPVAKDDLRQIISGVAEGPHILSAKKTGYLDYSTSINVTSSVTLTMP
jgi:hypothetical protein